MRQNDIENIKLVVESLKTMQHQLNEEWKHASYPTRNLKRVYVSEVWEPTSDASSEFFLELLAYSNLASNYVLVLETSVSEYGKLRARAKQPYSILSKLEKYISGKEEGKMVISKCLNDLLGTRYICTGTLEYLEILEQLKTTFEDDQMVRVVKSFHGTYNAVHLYIQEENSTFPWELQIWKQEDELSNEASHKAYKQEYAEDPYKY